MPKTRGHQAKGKKPIKKRKPLDADERFFGGRKKKKKPKSKISKEEKLERYARRTMYLYL